MENVLRAVATGLIFHFAAGLTTASIWRLTSARKAEATKRYHGSNQLDAFFEVMIWPLYLIFLFSLFIKSLVDLILEIESFILHFLKKWGGEWMSRMNEIKRRKKTVPIIVESELGNYYLHCGGCHAPLDSLRRKIMNMILMKPAERKPLRCPKCKILLNFKRIGMTLEIVPPK